MEIKFSLILPSRNRLELLTKLLASIKTKTKVIEEIDCWVCLDDDDKRSTQAQAALHDAFRFVRFLTVPRQDNFSIGYYNEMAKICKGKYVWALNDDAEIITQDWDDATYEYLEKNQWQDRVCYGRAKDSLNYDFSCFPILSREAINALGFYFHPDFRTWGADQQLFHVFRNIGRIIDCPVETIHYTYVDGSRPRDRLSYRVEMLTSYNFDCEPGETTKLNTYIREYSRNVSG